MTHLANRGAEQGDPHGSLHCGVVLSQVRQTALQRFAQRKGVEPTATEQFDFWYADDGQFVCRPGDVDLFLSCLDESAAEVGLTRGSGSNVKSTVRLVAHSDALASFSEDWITELVRHTCVVQAPNSCTEVLGSMVGDSLAVQSYFCENW